MAAPDDGDDAHVGVAMGVYVLGGLAPAESEAIERHLLICAECRASYQELVEVADYLSLLRPRDLDGITADGITADGITADGVAEAGSDEGRR